MAELKPCPCCGEDMARVINDNDFFRVRCDYCGLQTEVNYKDEEGAIDSWNMRSSNWHKGTPTEEGLYAVYYLDDHNPSATPYEVLYDGFLSPDGEGNWIDRDGERRFIDDDIVRWQKIEPFVEDKLI